MSSVKHLLLVLPFLKTHENLHKNVNESMFSFTFLCTFSCIFNFAIFVQIFMKFPPKRKWELHALIWEVFAHFLIGKGLIFGRKSGLGKFLNQFVHKGLN